MRILWSEWIKTKRTAIRWLTFFMPIVFSALIICYYSIGVITDDIQISIYQAFFEVWMALVIPLGSGLISGFMIHQEELAGGFNGFLGSSLPRHELYLGKFTILILSALVSTVIALLTLIVGLSFIVKIQVSLPIFIAGIIMGMIGTLPLLALHLWISLAYGMGASIGIGGGGLLIASLMGTSLGDKIWQFVPWAWPIRLSMLPGAYLLYKPGMKYPPQIISSGFIINQAVVGLIWTTIFLMVMLVYGIIWFKKWEGRKVYE